MSDKRDYQHHVWYTRSRGEVNGPFPIGLVRRMVLLGRLSGSDEVSPDKNDWRPIRAVSEVIPPEMKNLETEEDRMRLKLAQIHEDDRGSARSLAGMKPFLGRRSPDERHSPEMQEILDKRAEREEANPVARRKKYPLPSILFVLLLLCLIIGAGIYEYLDSPVKSVEKINCDAPAEPAVVWSYCKKEGLILQNKKMDGAKLNSTDMHGASLRGSSFRNSDLSYALLGTADLSYTDFHRATMVGAGLRGADLSYARLDGVDLSFADLRFANLGSATLDGAKLGNAIWVDGSICSAGSIGSCILAGP